jgi:hypothetical protein
MLDGTSVAINPETVMECFDHGNSTRVRYVDGSYTDVEVGFEEAIKKLDEASMTNGIKYLIDAVGNINPKN